MIARFVLVGLSAIAAACGSSSTSSTGGAGAAAGSGGATGGGAGVGGNAGKGAGGGGAGGTAGKGGVAGASGGAAVGGAAAGDAGSGGAPRAGAGGESGGSGASADGGAGGDDTPSDCRVDGCPSGTECLPVGGSCGGVECRDPDADACVDRPVCGCDGTVYPSNCAARDAGVGAQGVVAIGFATLCTTPPSGYFDCLGIFCDRATEYCDFHRHYGSSTFPVPCEAGESWSAAECHPLPPACDPNANCGCLTGEPFDPGMTMSCSPSCLDVDGVMRACQSGCFG